MLGVSFPCLCCHPDNILIMPFPSIHTNPSHKGRNKPFPQTHPSDSMQCYPKTLAFPYSFRILSSPFPLPNASYSLFPLSLTPPRLPHSYKQSPPPSIPYLSTHPDHKSKTLPRLYKRSDRSACMARRSGGLFARLCIASLRLRSPCRCMWLL
jgi:hypothetical protein